MPGLVRTRSLRILTVSLGCRRCDDTSFTEGETEAGIVQ